MTRIAILTGGTSSEREISLRSAANVAVLLKGEFGVRVFDLPAAWPSFLVDRPDIEVALPLIHGRGGEDGTLQKQLEDLRLPYLFSGVEASARAMDKQAAKRLVAAAGVRVPRAVAVSDGEKLPDWSGPVVVKPIDGGSSVGTTAVQDAAGLPSAVAAALESSPVALIEDFVAGEEYTVAVIEERGVPLALPVILIRAPGGLFDYRSKYDRTALAEEICPAPISPGLSAELQDLAMRAHQALGCRQVSRTDIIVDEFGQPWFLETNTIPGMTATSLLPKALAASGRSLSGVLAAWIRETAA